MSSKDPCQLSENSSNQERTTCCLKAGLGHLLSTEKPWRGDQQFCHTPPLDLSELTTEKPARIILLRVLRLRMESSGQ
ncbi:Hypothetical predicted protein [Marmota monax]|uniref:Uncharacterized protein n=1 Tax=Marmota monax TaxID=9995 RepID=A0A5E4AVE9_MARMO|nr:hypothetical protein GHT09_001325 [Marmota monax]VTJ61453.1 Hypothetical predicted protein [Marmota monax]